MESLGESRNLIRLREASREFRDRREDELADCRVRVGRDEDLLEQVDDVLLTDSFACRTRPFVLFPVICNSSSLQENVSVFSDRPYSGERERFLRDIGFERSVQFVDSVGLEIRGVGDESNEA